MVSNKSLDEIELIVRLLHDAHASWSSYFNARALRLTSAKMRDRARLEGIGFLTKTLPRLGKCLDQALAGVFPLTQAVHGCETMRNSELPKLLGEFFSRIFQPNGVLLPDPDANCVSVLRLVLYSFYKYETPYTEAQKQQVVRSFIETENDLTAVDAAIANLRGSIDEFTRSRRRRSFVAEDHKDPQWHLNFDNQLRVVREARILLSRLFSHFDAYNIQPRHGPGIVSTRERYGKKYLWSNVSHRITAVYPFDAYFCASLGHVCDMGHGFKSVTDIDHSAQVLLVPKDSRGPRLISCEPVDFQWIQQGLRQGIYELAETHPLTRYNVFFTNQQPNQFGALLGSQSGRYATLDLKEASDRVSVSLVHLLFPDHLHRFLDASRSASTVLPDGSKLNLRKFAPMGSALCFPIMALTIWALLTSSAPDADTRDSILVYGDDVIVPTAFAESAMNILEVFGLRINRTKSCTQGLFRESCGMDAFKGIRVTPVRFRTVWDDTPSPHVYTSWIAYANQLWDRRCYYAYDYIVGKMEAIYGPIPGEDISFGRYPSLRSSTARSTDFKRKSDKKLHKLLHRVRVEVSSPITQVLPGWNMLLRFFAESQNPIRGTNEFRKAQSDISSGHAFAVSQYTKRHASILAWRWR